MFPRRPAAEKAALGAGVVHRTELVSIKAHWMNGKVARGILMSLVTIIRNSRYVVVGTGTDLSKAKSEFFTFFP